MAVSDSATDPGRIMADAPAENPESQTMLHDLTAWYSLGTEQQERMIGRTKIDDIEIDDDHRADNSHVTLTTIVDEGVEHDILRNNMVFVTPAVASTAPATSPMPRIRRAGTDADQHVRRQPAGNYDRVLDVSTPVTGSLFFIPSLDLLESLAD